MKKGLFVGSLVASVLLLGACQKSDTDTTVKSTKHSTNQVESTNSSSSISNSSTSTSSIKKIDNSTDDTQNNLTNEELAVAIFIAPDSEKRSINTVIDDYTNAYEEDTGYSTKIQLSKNLLPDIIVSFSSMGSTQRFHFDGDLITVTSHSNSGDKSSQNFSIKELNNKFSKYQEEIAVLVSKAENYSPLDDEQSESAKNSSDANVDTKNLTSQQLKEWVGAVLDKQFSMGRASFPYKLSIENKDGYAYVRVNHSTQQVDTIDMFRINSSGQLEEQDLSNGYPATYKVVSSKFMDTSEVTVMNN